METPNVLLVIMDSVRAANCSLYGYDRTTTPNLVDLASEASVYTQARAPGSKSLTSHCSIFTGYHVVEHGFSHPHDRLAREKTIWSHLSGAGYATGVFSSNPFLENPRTGLTDGFETQVTGSGRTLPFPTAVDPREFYPGHVDPDAGFDWTGFLTAAIERRRPVRSVLNGYSLTTLPGLQASIRRGAMFTDAFLDWHSATTTEPWAACINYMDAHADYRPSDEHDRWASDDDWQVMDDIEHVVWEYPGGQRPWREKQRLKNLYDGCIRQVDAEIGRIVSTLKDRGEWENTLLVVTADHGEGFGEESVIRPVRSSCHGSAGGMGEQILHIPLLVSWPGQSTGETIHELATLTQFPRVVRAAVDGDTHGFEDGNVVASNPGMTELGKGRAEEYVSDTGPYEEPIRLAYDSDGETVRKYVEYGDHGVIVRYEDTQRVSVEETTVDDVIADRFDSLSPVGILESEDELSPSARARLEDLGYA